MMIKMPLLLDSFALVQLNFRDMETIKWRESVVFRSHECYIDNWPTNDGCCYTISRHPILHILQWE